VGAQEQHDRFAVVVQPFDLGQRPQPLPGEPFGHQRQELPDSRAVGELIERGVQEPLDGLGAVDAVELLGQPGGGVPQQQRLIHGQRVPRRCGHDRLLEALA